MKTTLTIPAAKILMMKASLRCLMFGLLGLLPIIGLPFALAAHRYSFQARRQEKRFWNPARRHRLLGLTLACIGTLVWSLVDTMLVCSILNAYVNGQ